MHKATLRFAAAPLAAALALTGCEYLRPGATKKMQIPANLAIEHEAAPQMRPLQTEPLAQEPPKPAEVYPATGGLIGARPEAPEAPARKEGKYTLNFDDADLSEVAKTILDQTLHINYVLSPKVTGKVTLQTTRPLAEDELIPTLEMLLRMNGAVLIKSRDLYRIEPDATALVDAPGARLGAAGQALGTGYQLRVVPLRYVGVTEMQKVIEPMMPPKAVVRADETRNLLMLAGTAEELEGVLDTIRLFDVDFMRGMTVGLYPLKNVEAGTLVEELDKVLGDTRKGPLAGLIRLLPIDRLNAVLAVTPQPRYLDEVESWIERLDRYSTTRIGGIHVYRVQNVDAMELANTLSAIFGGGQGGRGGRPSLTPGQRGSEIGGGIFGSSAFGTGGSGTGGGLDDGGSTGGGAFGSAGARSGLGSTGGSTLGGGTTGGRRTGGLGGGSGSFGGGTGGGLGGTGGGMGATGGGGFSGGIGRGTGGTGRGGRGGSMATDLGNVQIVADPANNALIITAKAQEYKEIEAVIKELDVVPLQVLIDATIAEVTLSDELRYGLQWLIKHGSFTALLGKNATAATTDGDTTTILDRVAPAFGPGGGLTYSMVTNSGDVQVIMSALANDNKVNVLSSPSLMVLNNQEASIKVGDQVPILTSSSTPVSSVGGTLLSTNTIQYRDTGVILNVRPRVNAGGLVLMDLEQAVDNVATLVTGGIQSPTITQRQIKSSVAVSNGETLVLGGLIQERSEKTQDGIPWLYKLPLLGPLFGTTTDTGKRTELVVLLTPRVVENRNKARDITNEFRRKLSGLYEQAPPPQPTTPTAPYP
jgi:general secretion pathway protein D